MIKNVVKTLVAATAAVTLFALGLSVGASAPVDQASSTVEVVYSPPTNKPTDETNKESLVEVAPANGVEEEEEEEEEEESQVSELAPADDVFIAPTLKTADDVASSPNETIFRTMETQSGATWGLDRIDGARDGAYNYVGTGSGVRIYIVDTGVDATHREFGSRVVDGFDAFGDNLDQSDCNGHGTHVAGIAAGNYYGVAKNAKLVPVRVMDCNGVGNTTTLTDGIEWILAVHSGGTGIVNMSLGGNKNEEVNALTSRLVDAGLVVVVAAGNSNADACNYSPASARGVIAVGAIDSNDARASFSNYGSCVDIWAPGVGINSANSLNHFISLRKSGTSQASPFVAGAIATYISQGQASTPAQAENRMNELAQNGIVTVEVEPQELVQPTPEPVVEPEPVAPEPEPSPSPVVDEPIVPDFSVSVEQTELGSNKGILRWSGVSDADSFEIHKASSIRPGWRVWDIVPGDANARVVIDQPGVTAVYKVVALVGSQKIEIGIFVYEPKD